MHAVSVRGAVQSAHDTHLSTAATPNVKGGRETRAARVHALRER